jgi:hypothetical protein
LAPGFLILILDLISENFDNLVINSFWKFGFPLVRPLVEELLDSAYSKKYTEIFANFNWDSLLPPASF